MTELVLIPPDPERCQVERPSTWPEMPSFMTLGPVTWSRCENPPTWLATDDEDGASMTLCDECKPVMEKLFKGPTVHITVQPLSEVES